jgi:hypothetical protein
MAPTDLASGTASIASGVDPAAPRPPVGFRLRLPHTWTTVDLHPASADAWIRAYTRQRVPAQIPDATQRRAELRRTLGALVDDCRAQGVFTLLLLAGRRPADPAAQPAVGVDRSTGSGTGHQSDDAVGASLTLAWRRLTGARRIDVDGIAEALATAPPAPGERVNDRIVAVVGLPTGPATYLHTTQLVPAPGNPARREMTALTQFFVPVPGLAWLGVITAATTNLALADGIDAVADGIAHSMEFLPAPTT